MGQPALFLLYRLISWPLAGIFLFSGTTKLLDPERFSIIIAAYGLIPDVTILPVALLLSLLEVLAGLGLLLHLRWALETVTALIVLFMLILGYGLFMGLDVDCGCFGPGDPEGEAFHSLRPALYRDTVLLCACAVLFWGRRKIARPSLSLGQWFEQWIPRRTQR
ncbi:MAG: hypothetical protein BWK76_12110 [Desulfobulbaceae bacterium A2]|nr:MAG: hypothetical protein BWK76_12110 [Desulfobulbaceae bacterium A2]